jgi:hypothetical protein
MPLESRPPRRCGKALSGDAPVAVPRPEGPAAPGFRVPRIVPLTEQPSAPYPSGDSPFVPDCSAGPFLGTIWARRKMCSGLGSFFDESRKTYDLMRQQLERRGSAAARQMGSYRIPLLLWNRGEVHRPLVFLAQLSHPHPGNGSPGWQVRVAMLALAFPPGASTSRQSLRNRHRSRRPDPTECAAIGWYQGLNRQNR